MTCIRSGRLWLAAAAIAAAVPVTSLHADDSTIGYKELICKIAGCTTGERKCAELKGEIKDPVSGSTISVTWTCYEGEKKYSGGGATYDAEI